MAGPDEVTDQAVVRPYDVRDRLLPAAVSAIGGVVRPGQQEMALAVAEALQSRQHLLVQAGTGTGKSLAYLVPAVAHAVATGRPVVVATATLALQAQVVERDLPRVAAALGPLLGRTPTWQLLKGRRNYLCRHRLEGGYPPEDTLFDLGPAEPVDHPEPAAAGASALGREVLRVREWAAGTETGDRDELVPGVSDRAWRQVSVSAEECLGAQRCPMAAECFSERTRERAREVDVVVANHAVVAIDAFEGRMLLPEHDVLLIDEAHELTDRVTAVISDELTVPGLHAAARRARRAGSGSTEPLDKAGEALAEALASLETGRLARGLPPELAAAVDAVRDAARVVLSELSQRGPKDSDQGVDGTRQLARAAVTEVFDVAERLAAVPEQEAHDVVWVSRYRRPDGPSGPAAAGAAGQGWNGPDGPERVALQVAPLSVAGLVRERLLADRCVVLTSATLALGGSFDAVAGSLGLRAGQPPDWRALDVGSPFDYPRQGILYLARQLPPPGRDGLPAATLDEVEALITAAGGRTLGLFSSRRAAQEATAAMRGRLDVPVLCQGEDVTPTLLRQFAADPRTCLFGTLTLWQGVDVPGAACQLVIIDRIPFPRPDDPLGEARQQAVARAGGNGFMAVAATHAALRLAQGAGRLVRGGDDRGVVAVLDPRLATARYAAFLRASLPPFWATSDREQVLAALRRIDVD